MHVAACRAYNRYVADAFADVRDRLKPAAVISMNTPRKPSGCLTTPYHWV